MDLSCGSPHEGVTSSVAFNLADLHGPVVYFRYDRDDMRRGGHMGRQGSFDYGRDGFGNVVAAFEELNLPYQETSS
jgi:hypothetical protein